MPTGMTVNNADTCVVAKVLLMLWNMRSSNFNLQANVIVFKTNFRKESHP